MNTKYIYGKLIKKLHGKCIRNSLIHKFSAIGPGSNIVECTMDKYSYCGPDCQIVNSEIGAFCSISDHVFIGGAEHPIEWLCTSPVFQNTRHSGPKKRFAKFSSPETKKTVIGNDVWIGHGVPQEKIHLLPMGADDEEMRIDQKKEIRNEVRKHYGIELSDFLIVTGGKIDPKKNIHVLAQAVSNSKYKNIKMLIFGSIRDDLKETFKHLESERIHCIGWQPSNEVYRYFYAADIVMFPGLHSVLWEQAVASQVPCAFSRIKGFEHVDVGGNCVFMDGRTVDYYQPLIEQLFTDKDYYNQLYKNAQKDQTKEFLYSHIAQKVLDDVRL